MKTITSALALLAVALIGGPAMAQDVAITNATVHTAPGQTVQNATVVIRDGKIRAVGAKVAVPAGARVIDGTGKVVTAGLVAASSRLGLSEVSLERSTREDNLPGGKGADVIFAAFRAADAYNTTSVAIPVARQQGVTVTVTAPIGGLVSGAGAVFSLTDGRAQDARISDAVAMYATLGQRSHGVAQGSRTLALLRLREVLDDARLYNRQKRAYERNQMRSMAASRLDLEALQLVLNRRIPLVLRAERRSDILAGIRLGQELRIRVIIQGGTEAWMVADDLKKANVGVILDPSANLPGSFDRINVRDDNGTVLAQAGVTVAIAAIDSTHNVGGLRQLAGIAVANGMTAEQALAACTSAPAQLFGIDRGTVTAGKAADLVVWSGDAFELSTRAEHMFIGGQQQDLRSRQSLLFERYR